MTQTSAKRRSNRDAAIRLMRRPTGASLAEITRATGWQPHSARAVISGLRKAGLAITRTRDGKTSYYRIGEQA
jgi:DNA-binding transcriptional regulator PaaX